MTRALPRRTAVVVLGIALLSAGQVGCARTVEAPLTLDECVVGAWLASDHACMCAVGATMECGQDDCVESTALLLTEDGRALEIGVRRLELQRRFSAISGRVSPLQYSQWAIDGMGQLVITRGDGSEFAAAVSCDASTFIRLETLFGRASTPLEAALFAAWDAEEWADRPW